MQFDMTKRLRVRQARKRDAEAIAAIHVRAWQTGYRDIVPADFLADLSVAQRALIWEQVLADEELDHKVIVATYQRNVVGWLSYGACRDEDAAEGTAELHGLYIDPEWWSCGAGGILVREAMSTLSTAGLNAVTLWVLEDNQRARRFYAYWGFNPDGRQSVFARSGWSLPKLRLRRSLPL